MDGKVRLAKITDREFHLGVQDDTEKPLKPLQKVLRDLIQSRWNDVGTPYLGDKYGNDAFELVTIGKSVEVVYHAKVLVPGRDRPSRVRFSIPCGEVDHA